MKDDDKTKEEIDRIIKEMQQRHNMSLWKSQVYGIWQTKDKEEDEKYHQLKQQYINTLRAQIQTWEDPEPEPEAVPFEQDLNGTLYGYKVLVRLPDDKWLRSPSWALFSRMPDGPNCIWENNELTSAKPPVLIDHMGMVLYEKPLQGIYGCKRLEDLQEWRDYYRTTMIGYYRATLVAVRIAVFGDAVVETVKGFRAHKARIVQIIEPSTEEQAEWWRSYHHIGGVPSWIQEKK